MTDFTDLSKIPSICGQTDERMDGRKEGRKGGRKEGKMD